MTRQLRGGIAALVTTTIFGVLLLSFTSGQPTGERAKARGPGNPVAFTGEAAVLLLTFGLKDKEASDWNGSIEVTGAKLLGLEIVRGNPKAKVTGSTFALKTFLGKKAKKEGVTQPILRVRLDSAENASVKVTTSKGTFTLNLADVPEGQKANFLEEQVSVLHGLGTVLLTDSETEDDYPAMANAPDGTVWLVYNEYQKGKPYVLERVLAGNFDDLVPTGNGDQVRMKHFDGKTFSPCLDVTEPGLTIWRPTVTVGKTGVVTIAWAQQFGDNWEICYRHYTPSAKKDGEGKFSDVTRLTNNPGSDFHVVAASDQNGEPWLAWQSWRDGNFQIAVANLAKNQTKVITQAKANHWAPAIAANSKGNVYVAYDTYEKRNYDVHLQVLGTNSTKTVPVAQSARFEARPALAVDGQDRLWIAYEDGDEQWGKDFSTNMFRKIGFEENPGSPLYEDRSIRVKCLAEGKVQQLATSLEKAFPKKTLNRSHPRLALDADGGLWLVYRQHPLALGTGEVWNSYAARFDGKKWSSPRQFSGSANLLDNRPAVVAFENGILAVYSGDQRTKTLDRQQSDLSAAVVSAPGKVCPPELIPDQTPKAEMKDVHPNETADTARIRAFRMDHNGQKLYLYRGEFHRHTEYSSHRDGDGTLEDSFRYGLDAGSLDWMGNGDHDNGNHHEFMWWQIQKFTDLMNNPPHFTGVLTYERSNKFPNGHRNVILPKRGIRPLPRGSLIGTEDKGTPDTKLLYAYLKHFGGMCSSHTSATGMGTDWRDNDPVVEPVVEVYQGHRHNYEHPGAPRSATEKTNIGGWEPKGFVWNAFAKGYKLGFQASSDHVSTHMSYGVCLTDNPTRQGIIDAFKKRHSYAATDNIILEVRSGPQLMGDIFTSAKQPTLEIAIQGTAPVSKVHVLRNMKYVYTEEPKEKDVKLRYTDMDAKAGETNFYYVRVEQTDGNLAWASPMWITYRP